MHTRVPTLSWTILASAPSFLEAYGPFWAVAACLLSAILAGGLMEWWCIPQVPQRPLRLPGLRVLFFRGAFLRFSTPGYICLITACLGYCGVTAPIAVLVAGLAIEYFIHLTRKDRHATS